MPTRGTATSMQKRTVQTQFGNKRVGPVVIAHLTLAAVTDIAIVETEIFRQSILAFDNSSTTIDGGIVHIDTDATMEH